MVKTVFFTSLLGLALGMPSALEGVTKASNPADALIDIGQRVSRWYPDHFDWDNGADLLCSSDLMIGDWSKNVIDIVDVPHNWDVPRRVVVTGKQAGVVDVHMSCIEFGDDGTTPVSTATTKFRVSVGSDDDPTPISNLSATAVTTGLIQVSWDAAEVAPFGYAVEGEGENGNTGRSSTSNPTKQSLDIGGFDAGEEVSISVCTLAQPADGGLAGQNFSQMSKCQSGTLRQTTASTLSSNSHSGVTPVEDAPAPTVDVITFSQVTSGGFRVDWLPDDEVEEWRVRIRDRSKNRWNGWKEKTAGAGTTGLYFAVEMDWGQSYTVRIEEKVDGAWVHYDWGTLTVNY